MSSPKTISGQSQNYFGTTGSAVVPLSRISLDTGLRDYHDPSESGHVRILLSEAVTNYLEANGAECFLVVSWDKSDERSGRMILHLLPCSINQANAACRVAQGISKESKPRASKP